jgi:hypothetical protein
MVDWNQISAIATVISVLVVILGRLRRGRSFKLSADPEEGYAMLGGVIPTTISVKGNYKNFVRLSVPSLPPGLTVTFTRDKVMPKSWSWWFSKSNYTSEMTINVLKTVPGEVYLIVIRGAGIHGKIEDECEYQLTCLNPR